MSESVNYDYMLFSLFLLYFYDRMDIKININCGSYMLPDMTFKSLLLLVYLQNLVQFYID